MKTGKTAPTTEKRRKLCISNPSWVGAWVWVHCIHCMHSNFWISTWISVRKSVIKQQLDGIKTYFECAPKNTCKHSSAADGGAIVIAAANATTIHFMEKWEKTKKRKKEWKKAQAIRDQTMLSPSTYHDFRQLGRRSYVRMNCVVCLSAFHFHFVVRSTYQVYTIRILSNCECRVWEGKNPCAHNVMHWAYTINKKKMWMWMEYEWMATSNPQTSTLVSLLVFTSTLLYAHFHSLLHGRHSVYNTRIHQTLIQSVLRSLYYTLLCCAVWLYYSMKRKWNENSISNRRWRQRRRRRRQQTTYAKDSSNAI